MCLRGHPDSYRDRSHNCLLCHAELMKRRRHGLPALPNLSHGWKVNRDVLSKSLKRHRWTLFALAIRSGICYSFMRKINKGTHGALASTRAHICQALGIREHQLWERP